jgi:two-component system, sensor histidine kinase
MSAPIADLPSRPRLRRRLRYTLLLGGAGLLANLLSVHLPGAVPFLLGNMAFAAITLRLGWRWGLLAALLVTAPAAEPRWVMLAVAESALLALTRAGQGPLAIAWLRVWLPLAPAVAWLARPEPALPLDWLTASAVVLVTSMVGLLGARLLVQLDLHPAERGRQPLRDQLGARMAVVTATPLMLLMLLALQLRYIDRSREEAALLRHRATRFSSVIETQFEQHLRGIELAARLTATPAAAPLPALRATYPGFVSLLATDARGEVVAIAADQVPAGSSNVADRAYFREPRRSGRSYVSGAFRGRRLGNELIVAVSTPLTGPGAAFAGVIEGSLPITLLEKVLQEARGQLGLEYALVDRDGQLALSSLADLPSLAPPERLRQVLGERESGDLLRPPRSLAYRVEAQAVARFGWHAYGLRPLAPLRAEQTTQALFAALAALGLILLLRALADRLAGQVARPLRALADGLHAVDLRDPATLRPPSMTGGNTELQELIDGFDAMLARIGELHGALWQALDAQGELNRELEARVDRRTAELRAAVQRAERLAQAKSVFLANMSHELRTPLAAIIGYTEQALQQDASASERLDALRTIERNGRHLLEIVNDVLDASKIESGGLRLEQAPLSPLALAEQTLALLAPRAAAKRLPLRLEIAWPIPATVEGDRLRLQQVLLNLLGNALKFTEQGFVVLRVGADPASGRWWYEVEDSGIGIPPAQQVRLFERFEQADRSTTRRFGGTGLGLYISRELAAGMGGAIALDSALGRGSRFRLWLPLPEAVDWLGERGAAAAEAPRAQRAVPRLGGRVLLAEDVADLRRLVAQLIRRSGAEVVEVSDGHAAWQRALAERFDLLLLDMHMPVMDGSEATEALRADGYRGPIVALTADVIAEDIARYRTAGCDEVLAKPVDVDALFALLERFLPAAAAAPGSAAAVLADPKVQTVLAGIARRFRQKLAEDIDGLQREQADDDRAALAERLHRLKGSAGSFGFPQLSTLAAGVEARLRAGDPGGTEQALAVLLAAMRAAALPADPAP